MSDKRNEDLKQFIIPENFMGESRLFQGQLKTRNVVEGGLISGGIGNFLLECHFSSYHHKNIPGHIPFRTTWPAWLVWSERRPAVHLYQDFLFMAKKTGADAVQQRSTSVERSPH